MKKLADFSERNFSDIQSLELFLQPGKEDESISSISVQAEEVAYQELCLSSLTVCCTCDGN